MVWRLRTDLLLMDISGCNLIINSIINRCRQKNWGAL